ncbi:MAG TPA: oxygenase MpaB family protein [Nocardioides sp.]|nr:oxygenase MpaB family protein [Nocardioides sp.]
MSALPVGAEAVESSELDMGRYWDGIAAVFAGSANVALQLYGSPAVAYGVMESKVEGGRVDKHPFKRARTTFTYLAVAMLGDDEDRAAYREAVNGAHRHVRSTADSPVHYNAFDPALQLWVAACLYYGLVDTWERMHGPLDDTTADAMYRRASVLGTTLQMRPEMWPRTRQEFDDYFRRTLASTAMDEATAAYCRMLIRFEMIPWWLWPASRALGFMNTGYTPWQVREQLGLAWTPRHEAAFTAVNRAAGTVYDVLPGAVRRMPFNLYLWDVRRRVRTGRPLV